MRGCPLPKADCVSCGCAAADNASPRLNVRAMVEEHIDDPDVIATGSPMKRGFGMAASKLRVDIGARRDQRGYGLRIIGEMAGPVRSYVEQRTLIVDSCIRKIGVLAQ